MKEKRREENNRKLIYGADIFLYGACNAIYYQRHEGKVEENLSKFRRFPWEPGDHFSNEKQADYGEQKLEIIKETVERIRCPTYDGLCEILMNQRCPRGFVKLTGPSMATSTRNPIVLRSKIFSFKKVTITSEVIRGMVKMKTNRNRKTCAKPR